MKLILLCAASPAAWHGASDPVRAPLGRNSDSPTYSREKSDALVHTAFSTIVVQLGRVVAMVTHLLLFTVVTVGIMNIGSFGGRVKNKSMKKFQDPAGIQT